MMRCRRRLGNNGFYQSGLTFHAPFDDPTDPKKVLVGGALTMVRATKGWYLNPLTGLITEAANNILRIEANGALIEGQRTNLLLYSEVLDSATGGWSETNITPGVNATTAPDGETTAEYMVEANTNATFIMRRDVAVSAGVYTLSAYAKQGVGSTRRFGIRFNTTNEGKLWSLETGEVVASVGPPDDYGSESLGNGWWRFWVTATVGEITENMRFYIGNGTTWANPWQGDGTSGIYMWGAQLEEATFPSSYIPTTDAAVSRNADDLTFASSGSLDVTVGTMIASVDMNSGVGEGRTVLNSDTIVSNQIIIHRSIDKIASSDGTTVVDGPAWATNDVVTVGARWSGSERALAIDGALITGLAFDGAFGSGSGIAEIGHNTTLGNLLYGHIQDLRIWDISLTDQQMKNLTL